MKRTKILYLLATALMVVGCNNDLATRQISPIDGIDDPLELCALMETPPPGCGVATCERGDSDCPTGTFCFNSVCAAMCSAEQGCDSTEECTDRGRCQAKLPDGGLPDAPDCPDATVYPTRITPNVLFIVDQSGSMIEDFGGVSRWVAAHDAISDVIDQTSNVARFGLVTYTAEDNMVCPNVSQLDLSFGLMSLDDNDPNYPRNSSGLTMDDTPTGDSIDEVVRLLDLDPPPADEPTVFVLATDGEPDRCEDPDGHDDISMDEVISAVQAAHTKKYDTFILSVGRGLISAAHLQEVANVGAGQNQMTGTAPYWEGDNPTELANHFRTIVNAQITCDVELNGAVQDVSRVCDGNVTMDGETLDCNNTTRGWQLKPGTLDQLQLLGSACTDWKTGDKTLEAVFPCNVVTVE